MTIAELLTRTRRQLAASGMAESDLDSRALVMFAFGLDPAALILRGPTPAPALETEVLDRLVVRRLAGEPVFRIIGRRAFYAHDFLLSPETLEPRPDTEALIDLCRGPIEAVLAAHGRCRMVDLGTGSGIIAISLLALYPGLEAVAVDISAGAVATARRNAEAARVSERFYGVVGDYLSSLSGPLDVIVSNPPYIPTADIAGLSREVRDHDPMLALDGGADGLDAYRVIAAQAAERLAPHGHALVEIGQGQEGDVGGIFSANGLDLAASAVDLGGTLRALQFKRREALGKARETVAGDGSAPEAK